MKNYIIYARNASTSQLNPGNSIETQIRMLIDYANEQQMKVISIFSDFGSCFTKRPAFESMLKRLERKDIDGVICFGLDRITRDCATYVKFIKTLNRCNVQLIIPKFERDYISQQKITNLLHETLMYIERKVHSERIKRGLRLKNMQSLLTNKGQISIIKKKGE